MPGKRLPAIVEMIENAKTHEQPPLAAAS